MNIYLFTGAANMRRAEVIAAELFGLGHATMPTWQECYQVDRAALALCDAVVIVLTDSTDAAEVLRCALLRELPVLVWREPGSERVDLELATHPLVLQAGGDLVDGLMRQALAVTASGMLRDHAAGRFKRQRYGPGHGQAILEAITRGGAA